MKFLVFFLNGLIEIKENDVSLIKKLACAVLTWTLRSLGLTGREGGVGSEDGKWQENSTASKALSTPGCSPSFVLRSVS